VARAPGPPGSRRWLIIAAAIVAVLLVAFTVLSGFLIDLLWFREVGLSSVFWTILRTKFALGLIFGAAFFGLLYVNLLIVRWITPRYRALSPDQEIIERYRLTFEPYVWWLLPAFSAFIALFVGIGGTSQWRTFLLWRNSAGVSFGTADPLFHRDAGFYVFSLPWLKFIQGWLFSALVGVTLISALAHYLWGGIRPQAVGEKVTPQVKAHLSVLLGLIVLTKAWGYRLGEFDLLTSPRGVVTGASYTDVNAQLPALKILVFIAIACAILFLVNIRLRGWALPVIAVGLLALVSISAGAMYPAFVQKFRVEPQEQQRERLYIERNIEATRRAFGLDKIEVLPTAGFDPNVTPQDLTGNQATLTNIRLWRPDVLLRIYKSLQRIKQYYEFRDVDVDRYELNGERRVVMISTREISQNGIPGGGGTWQNRHLVYTHGFGAVASQVNVATAEGAPVFTLRDIPTTGEPAILGNGARVYYGEGADVPFIVVNTGASELDFEGGPTGQQQFRYEGKGGIPIGNFFRRALFAWRFRDVNLMISNLIDGDSRIMIYRALSDRVPRAAPFLTFDADPYAAVVDGRLVWIWDAYTTTRAYPYSQELDLATATELDTGSALAGTANYIRNSVKVVVDAYDGTMKFYVADETDPIIRVWRNAFPDLFTSLDEASPDLRAHFRYPENLFQVQAAQYASYHVTDANVFYQKRDFWQVPTDPTVQANAVAGTVVAPRPLRPYYVLMRLPGEASEEFVLITPFTPAQRQNMVAWMAAKSDPTDYGQVVVYLFPTGQPVDGPTQVFSRIQQDPRFSADQTLFGQSGSNVVFGDFLVVPIANTVLYVQPVFVESEQANAIPELKRVLVGSGNRVGLGNTFAEALADAVGGAAPGPGPGPGPTPSGNVGQQISQLIQRALDHFTKADAALKAGDLATYQSEIQQARALIEQADRLASRRGAAPSPAPPATPTASPAASPGP